jgi:chromate reductase, NAD(P)H dehydrogenase (quinone)
MNASTNRTVAMLVGSLRKDSFARKIGHAIAAEAPAGMGFREIGIGELGFYNQDLDAAPPQAWTTFRDQIRSADAVLFLTPEYNRSVPGVLKNAIDIGSRPYGQSAFNGKPAAVVSSSVGGQGGFGANQHLRQSLAFLNMPVLPQPEVYLANVGDWFDADGAIRSADTRAFLATFAAAFAQWIERVRT